MSAGLHWTAEGPAEAPVLVLLNGVGMTGTIWDPVVGPLTELMRVVRVDARGHGESPPAPAGRPCTLADLGQDVLDVLDAAGVTRAHVAGLSLGGMTAMWLAIHHPARVARLALVCTSAHLPPAQGWLDRAATVRSAGMAAIADTVVGRWLTPGLAERDPQLRARLHAMLTGVDPESYAQCCEAIAAMDLRADLKRIAATTLVVAGAHDPATPLPHAGAIVDGIAGAQLTVVDAAHVATVEQPGAVATRLVEHFGTGRDPLRAGFATRRAVLGDEYVNRAVAATSEFSAPFQDFLTRYAWGEIWTRPVLTRRERSLITVAVLTALGAEHELAVHVRAALRNGAEPDEIAEALLHTAVYAGMPRSNRAFAIAGEVLRTGVPEAGR
jgi:3-oxoadipate enol-lactonase/4-carboxymuconolactone decarboxylase